MDDVRIPTITEIQSGKTSIPIPDPSYLLKQTQSLTGADGKLFKHAKEYDKFCHWSALPKSERNPKTITGFEKKWRLPKGYAKTFKKRKSFQKDRLSYFWEWMMDKFPDVVESMYHRALKNSSADARYFAELISKHIDIEQPQEQRIQNLVLVGVQQDKIDALFTPKHYIQDAEQLTPQEDE